MPLCQTYEVGCVPGSSPARGYLLPTNRSLIRHDQVCDTPDRPAILRKLGLGSDLSKVKCTCPSSPVLPHASEKKCSTSQRQQVFQCSAMPLVPPSLERLGRVERLLHPSRARVDVLLAVSDHVGHGFFAIVERVANQVLYARASGLEPYVFVGELLFSDTAGCEHGFQAYHEAAAGDNVWNYFFLQPGQYRLGDSLFQGRRVRSVQAIHVEALYTSELPHPIIKTYAEQLDYDHDVMLQYRIAAHSLFANGSLVRPHIKAIVDRAFSPWREASSHILGVHLRGTDKVVRSSVPPEAYFPLIDAWISRYPDALIFVATDDRIYLRRLLRQYGRYRASPSSLASVHKVERSDTQQGRVVFHSMGYETNNVISDSTISSYRKGAEVLVDALLLSRCDFLIKTTSAVAEFAIWVNLALHHAHIDLQKEDRFRSQKLPPWAEAVGADDAKLYCEALKVGCAIEARRKRKEGSNRVCARCLPSVHREHKLAARSAHVVPRGTVCDSRNGLRLLTVEECRAFALQENLSFIGTQSERNEFPGCIRWARGMVEFNDHRYQHLGCQLQAPGDCICI